MTVHHLVVKDIQGKIDVACSCGWSHEALNQDHARALVKDHQELNKEDDDGE